MENFTHKWILGIGGSNHEFSATLMFEQDVRVGIEQERLSRIKHGVSPWFKSSIDKAINYCLSAEGISLNEVEIVVSSDMLPARVRHELRAKTLHLYSHHLCHAASAYMMLPPGSKAGVLVYDGFGSIIGNSNDSSRDLRETFSFYLFSDIGYEKIGGGYGMGRIETDGFEPVVTNSIGQFYDMVTGLLGFNLLDSGKTMGLSSHGVPKYLDLLESFIEYRDEIDNCFGCDLENPAISKTIEELLISSNNSFEVKANIAASVQAILNKVLLHCASFFCGRDIQYLAISGGCGLNTVANSYLVDNSPLEVPVVIPPFCGDAGLGLGALWCYLYNSERKIPNVTFRNASFNPAISRPGKLYDISDCKEAINSFYPQIVPDSSIKTAHDLAQELSNGNIVGIFNGRSEIGPRALGGRSIFADPRSAVTRERINRVIKKREPFRPFAPIVLASDYEMYFHNKECMDRFMLKTSKATAACLQMAPATVHVDGTARVQIVYDNDDPFLVDLLNSFKKITGIGLILNTSFNRRGEPIVESPIDAVDAFLGLGLDGLYLDGQFFRRATIASNFT